MVCGKGLSFFIPLPQIVDWLIFWSLTPFSTVFQLHRGSQCTCPCFPGFLLTSTQHNILSKPLAAFPHNRCRSSWQWWERNFSCRNDYHQSSENILAESSIEPATACSQVRNGTDWAMGLDQIQMDGRLQARTPIHQSAGCCDYISLTASGLNKKQIFFSGLNSLPDNGDF